MIFPQCASAASNFRIRLVRGRNAAEGGAGLPICGHFLLNVTQSIP